MYRVANLTAKRQPLACEFKSGNLVVLLMGTGTETEKCVTLRVAGTNLPADRQGDFQRVSGATRLPARQPHGA